MMEGGTGGGFLPVLDVGMVVNLILRFLLQNTKFPLFTGFMGQTKISRLKYAINPKENTKFKVVEAG